MSRGCKSPLRLDNLLKITMKVRAKYNVAYKSVGYHGGDQFEMDERDYGRYIHDVDVLQMELKVKPILKMKTKAIKGKKK